MININNLDQIAAYLIFLAPRYQIKNIMKIENCQKDSFSFGKYVEYLEGICGIFGWNMWNIWKEYVEYLEGICVKMHISFVYKGWKCVDLQTKEDQKTDIWSAKKKKQQPENKFNALFRIFVKINMQK